jgi:hypothetical protein
MAIRLLLGRQIGGVGLAVPSMRNPLGRFTLATFTGRDGTLKARIIIFNRRFLRRDSWIRKGRRLQESRSKDRLIALGKVMDELCYNG